MDREFHFSWVHKDFSAVQTQAVLSSEAVLSFSPALMQSDFQDFTSHKCWWEVKDI